MNMLNEFDIPHVSELVASLKGLIEDHFQEVSVHGEVSNLSLSSAGHWYFTLSDEKSSLSCSLFRGDALRNPLIKSIKNGDQIIVFGPLTVYQKRGTFQVVSKKIFPFGEGNLKLQFEKLKAKLTQQGLFDIQVKKKIPMYPKKIGVITALNGAALQDFLNVMKRRCLWMDVVIIPSIVQGEQAPLSLKKALERATQIENLEVLVLTRGGGSLEDLWAFNDESLVKMIYSLEIPVISAIGHQVDFTLCDYVSDLRVETPTAAAELLSQPQTILKQRLHHCHTQLRSHLNNTSKEIELLLHKYHPQQTIMLLEKLIDQRRSRLEKNSLKSRGEDLIGLVEYQRRLDESFMKFGHLNELRYTNMRSKLVSLYKILCALDPSNVLNRGYSFLKSGDRVISSCEDYQTLSSDEPFNIYFKDGSGQGKKA